MPQNKRVVVVTDSTSDIPQELVERYQIPVVPLNIIWGNKTYRDRLDMDGETFYKRLVTDSEFPKTSQPSPQDFVDLWQQASPDGQTPILSVHVGSTLSGTIASAEAAKVMRPDIKVEIVDTLSASLGLGLIALAAVRAADRGCSLEECAQVARDLVPRTNLLFVVDTLEFLHRGGRIGGAARLALTMLNIKPLLELNHGKIEPAAKVRTRSKAIEHMLELVEKRAAGKPMQAAILYTTQPEEGERLKRAVQQRFDCRGIIVNRATPTIGAHVGPGTVGMAFYTE